MKNLELEKVEAMGEYKNVTAGGYVVTINEVYDNQEKGSLEMNLDICEGEFNKYYEELMAQRGFWGLKGYQNYENKTDKKKDEYCKRFFKGFITKVEESNEGYNFINSGYNEKTLIGKRIGVVLGKKFYVGNDGATKSKLYVAEYKTIEDIHNGNYTIPDVIGANIEPVQTVETFDENELPF